jgi:hypothetical protein
MATEEDNIVDITMTGGRLSTLFQALKASTKGSISFNKDRILISGEENKRLANAQDVLQCVIMANISKSQAMSWSVLEDIEKGVDVSFIHANLNYRPVREQIKKKAIVRISVSRTDPTFLRFRQSKVEGLSDTDIRLEMTDDAFFLDEDDDEGYDATAQVSYSELKNNFTGLGVFKDAECCIKIDAEKITFTRAAANEVKHIQQFMHVQLLRREDGNVPASGEFEINRLKEIAKLKDVTQTVTVKLSNHRPLLLVMDLFEKKSCDKPKRKQRSSKKNAEGVAQQAPDDASPVACVGYLKYLILPTDHKSLEEVDGDAMEG